MPYTAQVSVGTTATVILAANRADQVVSLHSSSGTIYIGDANVTSSTGYKMDNGDKLTVQLSDHETLYGITGAGTATMQVYATIN